MNIYHVFVEPKGEEAFMIALGLYSTDQVQTLGSAFPDIARIETWNGDEVYKKRTVH